MESSTSVSLENIVKEDDVSQRGQGDVLKLENDEILLRGSRKLLYLSHFGNQFSELAWQFCLVIWLAQVTHYESLIFVSTYGVTLQAMVCVGTPIFGRYIDEMARKGKRSLLTTRLIAAENICVLLATLCCAYLILGIDNPTGDGINDDASNNGQNPSWQKPSTLCLLLVIHILGGMAQVLDRSFLVAVERDWIVVMAEAAGENKDNWLSQTNVALKQIDLTCQVVAPAVTGWVLTLLPTGFGVLWVGLCNCLALIVEWVSMKTIASMLPMLDQAKDIVVHEEEEDNSLSELDSPNNDQEKTMKSLQLYFRQSMAFAGLGLALLYFNVLTFSGMMTAYLVSEGMSISTIGMWRGFSSVIGLLATFFYHQSAKMFSLQVTALWSIVWEFLCLSLTFASIFVDDKTIQLTLLIGGVIPSRIGLWVYDIAVTQLFQKSVAEMVRGQVGGTQMSLNALMEMLPFGLAFIYHKPSQFYVLIIGGYVAVAAAMLLFIIGFYLPHQQRRHAYEKAPSAEFQLT